MGNSHFFSAPRKPSPAAVFFLRLRTAVTAMNSRARTLGLVLTLPSLALVLAGCASGCPLCGKPSAAVPLAPVAVASATTNTTSAPPPAVAPAKVILPPSAATPPAPFVGEGWEAMFDGQTLKGWREGQFGTPGRVECLPGVILLKEGDPFTGINYTNALPKMNYEVAFDAMRVTGLDFFCGLTVPVGEDFCSLIVGGWGGSVVGISSLDGMDASENQTTKFLNFDQGRWYRIRLRITQDRLEGWIDQDKVVDVVTKDKKISLRPGDIELSKPFGVACYSTTAALREIKLRRVTTPADPAKRHAD